MKLVYIDPNPSGAYPGVQEGNFSAIPSGMAVWPDTLSTDDFYAYSGFVTLTVEKLTITIGEEAMIIPTVTACTPNTEAWEEWQASLPDPVETEAVDEPTAQDDTDAMLVDHEYRITLLELGVTE